MKRYAIFTAVLFTLKIQAQTTTTVPPIIISPQMWGKIWSNEPSVDRFLSLYRERERICSLNSEELKEESFLKITAFLQMRINVNNPSLTCDDFDPYVGCLLTPEVLKSIEGITSDPSAYAYLRERYKPLSADMAKGILDFYDQLSKLKK